jgi:Uri superfamily endonuclease
MIPSAPGAYILAVRLEREVMFEHGGLAGRRLPAGYHLYCGSAYGPGGLAARVGRHLSATKSLRWHVDHLTATGDIREVLLLPGGSECDLVRALIDVPDIRAPLPGFGSSDCRRCISHLLTAPDDLDLQTIAPAATVIAVANSGST